MSSTEFSSTYNSLHFQFQAASDVYSPVSGKVTEVNETLNDSPDLVLSPSRPPSSPGLEKFVPALTSLEALPSQHSLS